MMVPLNDTQVRLLLLTHVAARFGRDGAADLRAAGVDTDQLARLRELSALELICLAAMREVSIGVAFDQAGINAGLRAVALVKEAKDLEAYFIRYGASWQ